MTSSPLRALVVEDNDGDYVLTREMLRESNAQPFHLTRAHTFDEAMEHANAGGFDLYIVDHGLGARTGLDFIRAAKALGCDAPMLTGEGAHALDVEAMNAGAADYLGKNEITPVLLERAIRYALERARLQGELRSLSLVDGLTGLYNRRGFTTLAEQQLRLSKRNGSHLYIVFVDLDGMKRINDGHGHHAGDAALCATADILRDTFRDSDIIARLGGDEFAIMAVETQAAHNDRMLTRIEGNVAQYNATGKQPFTLSLSIGASNHDPGQPRTLEELLTAADEATYRDKRAKAKRN